MDSLKENCALKLLAKNCMHVTLRVSFNRKVMMVRHHLLMLHSIISQNGLIMEYQLIR